MISIKELAAKAGTSIASVSRVLNKKPGVNPEVRAKVERLIKELDYRPNLLARELLQKRTRLIGILLPTIHSYYADRIAGITDVFRSHKYGTMIASARENEDEEIENFFLFYEKQVEGIIFFATVLGPRHREVLELISRKIPVVCVGQEIEGLDISSVSPDNYQAGRSAMNFLLQMGHHRIGYVGGVASNYSAQQRKKAYLDVVRERGLPEIAEWVREGDFNMPSGYSETKALLESGRLPTAVFYCNDMMALGGLKAIHEAGLHVPRDLSILGFDDIPLAEYSTPTLTTVHQNHYDVGRQSAELLLERLHTAGAPPKRRLILEQNLVIRESVRDLNP